MINNNFNLNPDTNNPDDITDDQKEWLLLLNKEQKINVLINSLTVGLPVFLKLANVFLSIPPEQGGIPPEVINDLGDNRHAITDAIRGKKNYNIDDYGSKKSEEEFFEKYSDKLNLKKDYLEDKNFNDDE